MRSLGKRLRSARRRALLDQTSFLLTADRSEVGVSPVCMFLLISVCIQAGSGRAGREGPRTLAPKHSLAHMHHEHKRDSLNE